ncbi:MAG: thioredoxin domain-containing protein [bacterium]
MAKKGMDGGRGRSGRSGVVTAAKRGGPGKGFWVAVGLVAIVGIGTLSWVAMSPKNVARTIDPSLPTLKAEGYLMGSPTAPIEVIEFADYECPGCGQYSTLTEPDVRTRLVNTGKVRIRFMDFPLDIHKNTWDASLAASCANEQGKFWEMHDLIFANQDKWNGEATSRPRGPLGDLAKSLNLDMSKYGSCMDAETHRAQIQANQAEGLRRQVNSTPTFVIADQVVAGALPFDKFNEMVTAAIAKMPPRPDSTKVPATDTKKSAPLTPASKGQ